MTRSSNLYLHHKPHSISTFVLLIAISAGLIDLARSQLAEKTLYFQENVNPPATIGSLALPAAPDSTYQVLVTGDRISDLPGMPKYSEIFIFELNGEIMTRVRLDREQKNIYSLLVLRDADGHVYAVDIVVQDVNDNSPRFLEPSVNISIPETLAPDEQVKLLGSAVDPDAGDNSTTRYEIIGAPAGVFRLDDGPVRLLSIDLSVKVLW